MGVIQGSNLLWARARFEHAAVQINKFNKLTIEIFSKLNEPIKISSVELKMSQASLNQQTDFTTTGTGYFELNK
jgi:hypothetical protein